MCRFLHSVLVVFSLCGTFPGSSSAESLKVRPGENVTLRCNVPASTDMAWYRHSNNELTLIISHVRRNQKPYVDYTMNSSRFLPLVEKQNDSVDLLIVAAEQSDVGLYYCGGRVSGNYMQFEKPIHLTSAGDVSAEAESRRCRKLLIAAGCILALASLLCVVVFFKLGPPMFCTSCVKENSNLKEAELQYASLRHKAKSQERSLVPAAHNVTYDVVARKIAANPRA